MADAFYWLPLFAEFLGSGPAEVAAEFERNIARVIQAFNVADINAAANIINGTWHIIDGFMSGELKHHSNL
jgi:hypothetical protein